MALQQVAACPICGSSDFHLIRTCIDHSYSKESFEICRCSKCSMLLTNPRPDISNLGEYYKSENYISHTGKSEGIIDWIYHRARSFALNWKWRQIVKYKTGTQVLDIGCGTGEFIRSMFNKGWTVTGVEPSEAARQKAMQLNGQPIVSDLGKVDQSHFDVITLWHVLEHLPDLNQKIEQIKALLNQDGLIFVAVPNPESYDAERYGNYWAGYDVPRHLWHFTRDTMRQLMEKHDLEIKEIIPMKLDAFYVSLLSEKYQSSGWFSYARALLKGLKSNWKARPTMNYSSLLYIIKG